MTTDRDDPTRQQAALLVTSPAEFTVAMVGAWNAGLGILPLPPEFPDARLRDLLDQCCPRLLVVSASLVPRATDLVAGLNAPPHRVVIEDALARDLSARLAGTDPEAAAYTTFTSGSTGRPKGVLIRQDQLRRLIEWEAHAWDLGPWVRMAQTLSLAFDFGLQEVFTALPYGGCLVVPAATDRTNVRRYAEFLNRERVTVLFSTPSFADQMVAAGTPVPSLRLVLLGGEVLRAPTVAGLRALLSTGCRVVNGYGPTEATINCLAYEIPAESERNDAVALPVGMPSAEASIHLVDQYDQPVPVGACGEIMIGGPGVAAGYLGRPDLTAERFVSWPPGCDDASRVYRTGDIGYVDPDAGVVVIGRSDRQAKVRGYRVEPGEVESVLRAVPGVSAAAVLVVDEPRRLVAAVTGTVTSTEELLRAVSARLPAPMVPEQTLLLDRLPVTSNGKLDEIALRRTAQDRFRVVLPASASAHDVLAAVCRVWEEMLIGVVVRPDSNVFELGAHSLVVTRVHERLQATLRVTFPIHYLFEFPQPRELATRIEACRDTSRGDAEVRPE